MPKPRSPNCLIPLATVDHASQLRPRFACIGIGSFEQHGPHLPLSTDTLIAGTLAAMIAKEHNGLLLPPLGVSCSQEHAGFFGTAWLSAKTLDAILHDLSSSLAYSNIDKLVILNAHGGNYALSNTVQELNLDRPRAFMAPAKHHWLSALRTAGLEHGTSEDMHAGEIETSILMHAFPDTVVSQAIKDHDAPHRPFLLVNGFKAYSATGVIGFPSKATATKGEGLLQALNQAIAKDLQSFLAQT